MIRIEVKESFVHGGQHYTAGEVRYVSLSDAEWFVGAGWATADGLTANRVTKDVILDVHSGRHAHTDTLTGVRDHG